MTKFDFDDRERVDSYEDGARRFIPGYDACHAMAAVLLLDSIGQRGRLLVLGAGGGAELSVFAQASPDWTFVGVDPAPMMLDLARNKLEKIGVEGRAELIQGYIEDAPDGPFDAATAFLALHFIPDDGKRLGALKELRRRLAPGAPFLMVNGSVDKAAPSLDRKLRIYAAFARYNGASEELTRNATEAVRAHAPMLAPAREEALLAEAGFGDIELFYAGLTFRGWIATAR
jgi:tRNA (cmo5U34)-methyltransferase